MPFICLVSLMYLYTKILEIEIKIQLFYLVLLIVILFKFSNMTKRNAKNY
jgi:hypothetical protein